ncbi:hypothetical protein ACJMK2_000719 [Sinanodonta woodiana]|uniref:Uncharacterized protein n=1 Tax=Sinanodonta woodiana TaxID=1069815 RepID=A0ABD3XQ51_SINWO
MATSNEDLIASDAVDESEPKVLNCPLCQNVFRSPRRLPCSHSFCQDCLQSHISDTVSVNSTTKEFLCPICGNESRSTEEIPTDKWSLLFPLNTLLISVLMEWKVKVDLVCNICQTNDVTSIAEDLCTVCEEALCGKCSKVHKMSRLSTKHTILKLIELPSKQDIILNNHSVFHCMEHANDPVKHYCTIHQNLLCTKCVSAMHRNCSKVVELRNEEANIPDTAQQMKEEKKFLEHQLKTTFKNISLSNLSHIEYYVNEFHREIQALKKTINDALDDLDMRVKEEGRKICEKETERIGQLNHYYESHIMAIRNSDVVVESASKHATQSQMFQLTKTIINQLSVSQRHIEDKYSKQTITLQLEVNPQLKSISAIPRGEIGSLRMKRNDESSILCDGFKPLSDCIAEPVIVKGVQATGDMTPWYTSITFIPDMQVLVADYNNETCNMLDSKYDTITSYQLSGKPWSICMAGEKKVAITFPHNKSIQIISIQDNSITPIRQICTQYMCYGIACYNDEELIVSGPCNDSKRYYWSLITLEGNEKSCHVFDGRGNCQTYVALNALKTRLYISINKDNSLHCFGLDGSKYFTFTHRELKGPQAVALDRDDNVYLLVGEPNNILQLLPDGSLNQIIVRNLKKSPLGISFDHNGDKFVLTHFETTNISVYALKDKVC